MNFSYGKGNKVYGKDISVARYNALLETFYKNYSELQKKIKVGKNYFERNPQTAQFLEKRVLGENVYIPDEDQDLLDQLAAAYKTTRLDSGTCMSQKSENECNSLKFKNANRCTYEKKWFSYIRGGNCYIDQNIVVHLLSNLQSIIDIRWDSLKARPLQNSDPNLPNPDELTKIDMANIIHDLGYHVLFWKGSRYSVRRKTGKESSRFNRTRTFILHVSL